MKHIRQICTGVLAFIMLIGLSGCMHINLPKSEAQITRELLDYLEQKYGREFEALYFESGVNILNCYPKGGDPVTDRIFIEITRDKDRNKIYRDNGFALVIREDVEAQIRDACAKIPLSAKVYMDTAVPSDPLLDGSKTYEDLKARGKYHLECEVFILCEDLEKREQYADQIADLLQQDNYSGMVFIRTIPDTETYEKMTRRNKNDVFKINNATMFSIMIIIN